MLEYFSVCHENLLDFCEILIFSEKQTIYKWKLSLHKSGKVNSNKWPTVSIADITDT